MRLSKKILLIFLQNGFKGLAIRSFSKVLKHLINSLRFFLENFSIYRNLISTTKEISIENILSYEDLKQVKQRTEVAVTNNFLSHRFDFLGSGWMEVSYGMECRGIEGILYPRSNKVVFDTEGKWLEGKVKKHNLIQSQEVWKCVEKNYKPIDWQIDFKSGYRWSAKTWYKHIKYGDMIGADVKVPWELARMQHLPLLAKDFLFLDSQSEEAKLLVYEFRNQILDFIATNPIRYGVNWACTMDVAIRASNWLLAFDIFSSKGFRFDDDFMKHFTKSVYLHARHIYKNLEWNDGNRANHYLSNICGLAFISRYLNKSEEVDSWLSFSINGLISEVGHQFYEEGTNFEGSTSYHKLSAEMVLFSTCLILGIEQKRLEELASSKKKPNARIYLLDIMSDCGKINRSPFPEWYFQRLFNMAEFMKNISKLDNTYPQIGDNDNGRFFKLEPIYQILSLEEATYKFINLTDYKEYFAQEPYYLEKVLDTSHIQYLASSIFSKEKFINSSFDGLVASALMGKSNQNRFGVKIKNKERAFYKKSEIDLKKRFKDDLGKKNTFYEIHFQSSKNLTEKLSLFSYPEFGLYVFKSPFLYLSVRSWKENKNIQSGHMHFDQLSIELSVDGEDLISDPGSYIYTPFPEKRREYRSADAHFSPFNIKTIESEQEFNLFNQIKLPPVNTPTINKNSYFQTYLYQGDRKFFSFDIEDYKITFRSSLIEGEGLSQNRKICLSRGYGTILRNTI